MISETRALVKVKSTGWIPRQKGPFPRQNGQKTSICLIERPQLRRCPLQFFHNQTISCEIARIDPSNSHSLVIVCSKCSNK